MKDYQAKIVKNEKIADGIYEITFDLGEKANIRCGQFGNILIGGSHLLRRPIAICKADENTVTFCYQVKGDGTKKLTQMKVGEETQVHQSQWRILLIHQRFLYLVIQMLIMIHLKFLYQVKKF